MSKHRSADYHELDRVLKERSQIVLQKFGQVAVSGVSNSELLSILEYIKSYWTDMFRPALTSLSCEAVGGKRETADDASLIFTLAAAGIRLHDDIIDRSGHKNFRETILKLYGPDDTLLAGDFLITKAWTMVNELLRKTCQPTKIADIIEAYGNLSLEMCEAGFMEISCRKKLDTDLEYCKKILWHIGADGEACAKIGAIIGDGSPEEIRALAEFGRRIGFMFGLTDDLEDSRNIKGNLPHRLQYERVPLPLLYAAKSSKKMHAKIKSIIEKPPITASQTKQLLECCFQTEAFDYVQNVARQNAEAASSLLQRIKPSSARNGLELMIEKSFADIKSLYI